MDGQSTRWRRGAVCCGVIAVIATVGVMLGPIAGMRWMFRFVSYFIQTRQSRDQMMSTDASRQHGSIDLVSTDISQLAVRFEDPGNTSMEADEPPRYPDIQGYYLSREIGGGGFSK